MYVGTKGSGFAVFSAVAGVEDVSRGTTTAPLTESAQVRQ